MQAYLCTDFLILPGQDVQKIQHVRMLTLNRLVQLYVSWFSGRRLTTLSQ